MAITTRLTGKDAQEYIIVNSIREAISYVEKKGKLQMLQIVSGISVNRLASIARGEAPDMYERTILLALLER